MRRLQLFRILTLFITATLSSCRLTGYAEEEKKLSKDLCLSVSAIYIDRKLSRDPDEYDDTNDIAGLIFFCIVRPEYIDSHY